MWAWLPRPLSAGVEQEKFNLPQLQNWPHLQESCSVLPSLFKEGEGAELQHDHGIGSKWGANNVSRMQDSKWSKEWAKRGHFVWLGYWMILHIIASLSGQFEIKHEFFFYVQQQKEGRLDIHICKRRIKYPFIKSYHLRYNIKIRDALTPSRCQYSYYR